MLSRINPTLLLLPYLMQNARKKFVEIEDCLVLSTPGREAAESSLKVLRSVSSLQAHLDKVADVKRALILRWQLTAKRTAALNMVVCRYSEEKTLKWLGEMLARLKELLRAQNVVHHTILNDGGRGALIVV